MELKQRFQNHSIFLRNLLIVPYGIETYWREREKAPTELLIVPYGIETSRR